MKIAGSKSILTAIFSALSIIASATDIATPSLPPMPNPLGRELYFAAEGTGGGIMKLDASGKVVWQFASRMSRDVRILPGGNVLFPYNENYDSKKSDNASGVLEVDRKGDVVFSFRTTGQVFSCDRSADGLTLVGAASQGKILFVNSSAVVVRSVTVLNKPGHSCMRHVRALPDGACIVAEESANAAREYDATGKMVREFKVPFPAFSTERLANGHTLISGRTGIVECDAEGKIVWQIEARNFPNLGIRWCAGFQSLENGDILMCNAGGKIPLIRFTRDGRAAWQSNTEAWPLPMGHGVAVGK